MMETLSVEPEATRHLNQLSLGESAVVLTITAPPECACRLRALGLCEGASVCILHNQNPVIVRCDQTCMAICRSLMSHIAIGNPEQAGSVCPLRAPASSPST
jgi:Fe2+ transport system protein FeoA